MAAPRVLCATFAYNEGEEIRRTIARHPVDRAYDLLVVDDGSTDGASMKGAFALDHEFDILVIQAGNDKDDAREVLVAPILEDRADFAPSAAATS